MPPPIDFLSPDFQVLVNGVRLPDNVGVISVVVTHEPDSLDHFTLTVANEFPDLPFTDGNRTSLFQEGNAVTIKLGYRDALVQVFDGEVTRVTLNYPEKDSPTVTIVGHSRLHWLRGATKTKTFLNVTDSDIAQQIAGGAGLQAQVDATSTKHPFVMQVNQTDFDFLLERARRIRYEVLVEGKTLLFRKPADGKPKTYTLIWADPAAAIKPEDDKLPLTRFELTLDATAPATAVKVLGQNPSTRDPIAGNGKAGDEADSSGTSGAAIAKKAFTKARDATVVDLPVASQAEADEIAKALFNERVLQLVTGRGACIGMPKIRAGEVVELGGLGRRYSGAYFVTQSTHRMDASGYQTTFTVRRGAVGA